MPIGGGGSATDYNSAVRRGEVIGSKIINILGHKYALGTAEVVVGELAASDDIDQSGISTTPATVTVSSLDTNDTSDGSGMRTMTLTGLSSSGVVQSETITMTGQTAVTSSLTYSAICGMRALSWGATGWNEGIIYVGTGTVTTGKPAVICYAMGFDTARSRGGNKALCAYYVVPAAKTFYGQHLTATIGTVTKDVQMHLMSSPNGNNFITEEVFEYESASNIIKPILALPAMPAGTHIKITAISTDAGTNISCVLDGELVDD